MVFFHESPSFLFGHHKHLTTVLRLLVWFGYDTFFIPKVTISIWKSQHLTKGRRLMVWFGLVFLEILKSMGWYGFFYGFLVVWYLFHQCFILICSNIFFFKCCFTKDLIFTFEKTSLISVSVSGWLKCSVCVDLRKKKDTIKLINV
jgi:hypothetical protein